MRIVRRVEKRRNIIRDSKSSLRFNVNNSFTIAETSQSGISSSQLYPAKVIANLHRRDD